MAEMSPIDWAKRPLLRYAKFSGRAPRAEYWWFYLAYIVASVVASIVDGIIGIPALALILIVGLLVPMLAVSVRRLHDTDRTGWWLLAPTIPYLLGLVVGGAALFNIGASGSGEGAAIGDNAGSLGLAGILMLVGGVLAIVLLVFMILPGTRGPNRFGPDPYGTDNLDEVFA